TPFSSRLRHGFVVARENDSCDALSLQRLDGAAFVQAAYNTILRRDPDEIGERTYVAALSDGTLSKRQILAALLAFDEFLASGRSLQLVWGERADPPDGLRRVASIEDPRTTLLRDPDPAGKDHHSAQFSPGEPSKREIADAQLASDAPHKLPRPPDADGPTNP